MPSGSNICWSIDKAYDLSLIERSLEEEVYNYVCQVLDPADPRANSMMAATKPMLAGMRSLVRLTLVNNQVVELGEGGFGCVRLGKYLQTEIAIKLSRGMSLDEIMDGSHLTLWTQEITANLLMMGSCRSVGFIGWYVKVSLVNGLSMFSAVFVFERMQLT
eukprot:gene11596-34300_t